ncbi:MAG TPA: SdrD B-like domain-containing protein, partial [Tepidisphaeraceae bacterium]|nr:SdrD B-like domain-containing protein [Tepidisphaeraceae bacterium]
TDVHGQFDFTNLTAGVYRVSVIVPAGFRQVSPAQTFYDVAANGIDDTHAGENFGLTSTGIIRGTVFNDANDNLTQDVGEFGIAGITVFIDKNKNGHLDKGELSRTTDSNGNYRFAGLAASTYVIRIGVPRGMTVTVPVTGVDHVTVHSGQSRSNRNFGLL